MSYFCRKRKREGGRRETAKKNGGLARPVKNGSRHADIPHHGASFGRRHFSQLWSRDNSCKGNQGDKSQYGSRLYGFGDSIGSPHNGGQIQLCVAFEQNMVLALTLSILAISTLLDGINPR